jgi:hypothetical protein
MAKREKVNGIVPNGTTIGDIMHNTAVNSAHCVSVLVFLRVIISFI